jgi:hypothetical protein
MQAAVQQLAAAAGSHPSLRLLDWSCTGFTDQCLKALTQGQGSSWRWHQRTCQHLQELRLAGNSSLSGAAVVQLAKLLAAGSSLGVLHTLDLSNCPGIGDAGRSLQAQLVELCHLQVLGCTWLQVVSRSTWNPSTAVLQKLLPSTLWRVQHTTHAVLEHTSSVLLLPPPGAAALAACLSSSHHHSLRVLNLCGCEVTDKGAAALAAAVSGDSMADASGAAHSGESGSAGRRPAQHAPCLKDLRLADNQITAAGLCVTAVLTAAQLS